MGVPPTDSERFEALYRAHYAAIVRFAHRRIAADAAEEVVAETFAIAWRRVRDVPQDELPWLYAVARNVLSAQHRAGRSRDEKVVNLAALRAGEGARDPADAHAERDHVRQALASLTAADREALSLVAWEGLSHAQAAVVLGTSRVAFSMRLTRARRHLAAALGEHERPRPAAHPQETRP